MASSEEYVDTPIACLPDLVPHKPERALECALGHASPCYYDVDAHPARTGTSKVAAHFELVTLDFWSLFLHFAVLLWVVEFVQLSALT